METLTIPEIVRIWPQRSCWVRPGRGGKALVEETITVLRAAGFERFGSGSVPEGAEIVYAPTGSISPGGPGRRTRYYVGRWVR
jgi:hypothetical protein